MRPTALLFVIALPTLATYACVGDSAESKPVGSLGAPCFANGTCNDGLVCAIANGVATCQFKDAGALDASDANTPDASDASTPDASTLDASDANTPDANDGSADAGSDVVDAGPPSSCPVSLVANPCSAGTCIMGGTNSCVLWPSCGGGTQRWDCYGSTNKCTGSDKCCGLATALTVSGISPNSCAQGSMVVNQASTSATLCQASCGSSDVQFCTKQSDCPANTLCVEAKVTSGPATLMNAVMGVCAK